MLNTNSVLLNCTIRSAQSTRFVADCHQMEMEMERDGSGGVIPPPPPPPPAALRTLISTARTSVTNTYLLSRFK